MELFEKFTYTGEGYAHMSEVNVQNLAGICTYAKGLVWGWVRARVFFEERREKGRTWVRERKESSIRIDLFTKLSLQICQSFFVLR